MVQPVVKGSRIRAATIVESWELGEELSDITEAIDNATPRRHQFIEYPYAYRPRKKT